MGIWAEYLHLLIALAAIVDIPGNLPMFLGRTGGLTTSGRRITALTAAIATAVILTLFALAGEAILATFGITIAAFKVLGGLVILLMALEMLGLLGGPQSERDGAGENPVAIGIFPMAVPLFAGPGAISAIMVYAHFDPTPHGETHLTHDLVVGGVILSVALLIFVGLSAATALSRWLTPTVQDVLNRLLGIIVGALGVEFILEGVAALI